MQPQWGSLNQAALIWQPQWSSLNETALIRQSYRVSLNELASIILIVNTKLNAAWISKNSRWFWGTMRILENALEEANTIFLNSAPPLCALLKRALYIGMPSRFVTQSIPAPKAWINVKVLRDSYLGGQLSGAPMFWGTDVPGGQLSRGDTCPGWQLSRGTLVRGTVVTPLRVPPAPLGWYLDCKRWSPLL